MAVIGGCCPVPYFDVVETTSTNLHANLAGYWKVLNERTTPENHPAIDKMFSNHCSSCHASCGECHVSQPNLVGCGFIDGHLFNKTPTMTRNCTACHGSRVGNEYLGKHEDVRADVHFREGRMKCTDCHTSHEMHGQFSDCSVCHTSPVDAALEPPDHRYAGIQSPRCESCHSVVTIGDGIEFIRIALEEFLADMDLWPADKAAKIVVYCGSGHRSTMAAAILGVFGYTNVWSLKSGFGGWVEAGYPVMEYVAP